MFYGSKVSQKSRIILKDGTINSFDKEQLDLSGDLQALAINPPPEVSFMVQRIMYLKGREISVSDIIRSKILKDSYQIINLFRLLEMIEFADVEVSISSSNRNLGKEIFMLKKRHCMDICNTAKGRARLNLYRINKEMIN